MRQNVLIYHQYFTCIVANIGAMFKASLYKSVGKKKRK